MLASSSQRCGLLKISLSNAFIRGNQINQVCGLAREPRWGRSEEEMGEDP